jgi:hypothetical protein
VRRWLGQKALAMTNHDSEIVDISVRMQGMMKTFDPLGSKKDYVSVELNARSV